MRAFLEDHPKLAFGLIGVATLIGFGGSILVKNLINRQVEFREEYSTDGRPQTHVSDRLVEIRKIEYKDSDRALILIEDVLKSPIDSNEEEQAALQHANILQLCFHMRLRSDRKDEAQEFMERLKTDYPDSHHFQGVRRSWSDYQKRACRSLLKDSHFEEARSILGELTEQDLIFQDARFIKDYQMALIEIWKESGMDNAPAMKHGLAAAYLLPHINFNAPFPSALHQSRLPGYRLLELASQIHKSPLAFRSIPFYQAALYRLKRNSPNWHLDGSAIAQEDREKLSSQIEAQLAPLYEHLGDNIGNGEMSLATTLSSEDIYMNGAILLKNEELRVPLYQKLIASQRARLASIFEPVKGVSLHQLSDLSVFSSDEKNTLKKAIREAGNLCKNILQKSGPKLWSSLAADRGFDTWSLLSDSDRAALSKKYGQQKDDTNLRRGIASLTRNKQFEIPLEEIRSVRLLQGEVNARRGLLVASVQPTECVNWLRKAMNGNRSVDFRSKLVEATGLALMNHRGASGFKTFYELTRFFVSDIGLKNLPGHLKEDFKTALSEGAERFKQSERPKSLFLWAVEAKAYMDSPEGLQAKDKALREAFDFVSGINVESVPEDRLDQSPLSDYSLLTVDNSTEHELLIFYKGPESFFLTCGPYRKFSAIVENGSYEVAVITPSGAIQPFHGKVQLNNQWHGSNYHISSSDTDEDLKGYFASAAWGDSRLARKPDGSGTFSVDKKTGRVAPL
ncbi:MAG TPA: hypothetical protein EYQ50_20640 [Verrucomicrobiales bacterium]|nr:hypothetical protein [Verrucomicrobiales bacterium]HIL69693.1 hypothetical protein [Verrucomicrobiota bacterium]